MIFENEHPNGNLGKKPKSLQIDEKSVVALLLADDALAPHSYFADEMVEVEIGEVSEGDLAAILLTDGRWFVGYISFEGEGVLLAKGHNNHPPAFFHTKIIIAWGRVSRRHVHPTPGNLTNIWSVPPTETFVARSQIVMTWQMDSHGAVIYADQTCRRFLGLSEQQLRAGVWKTRLHPDDRSEYLRSRERSLREGKIYQNDVRVLDAHDEYRRISIVVVPIHGDSGRITGWHAVAQLTEGRYRQSA